MDLDIVYLVDPENIQRLLTALQAMGALDRDLAGRKLKPTASHLTAGGHNLLNTMLGPLDVLGYIGAVGAERRYGDLLPDSVEIPVRGQRQLRVLNLPTLIAVKQEANREKDRVVLPLLRQVLEEQRQRERETS